MRGLTVLDARRHSSRAWQQPCPLRANSVEKLILAGELEIFQATVELYENSI
jgi:hypothetical protein